MLQRAPGKLDQRPPIKEIQLSRQTQRLLKRQTRYPHHSGTTFFEENSHKSYTPHTCIDQGRQYGQLVSRIIGVLRDRYCRSSYHYSPNINTNNHGTTKAFCQRVHHTEIFRSTGPIFYYNTTGRPVLFLTHIEEGYDICLQPT